MNVAQWNDLTRAHDDKCAQTLAEYQSQQVGNYSLKTPGFRPCQTGKQYAVTMQEPAHYSKVYRSGCYINRETDLYHAQLSNPRVINHLRTRPYVGSYMGAGSNTSGLKDVESRLLMGESTTTLKSCQPSAGARFDDYRFNYLPKYGNPQRVKHVVEPWVRGGEATRDFVRRVNYEKRLANARNSQEVNRMSQKQAKNMSKVRSIPQASFSPADLKNSSKRKRKKSIKTH